MSIGLLNLHGLCSPNFCHVACVEGAGGTCGLMAGKGGEVKSIER